MSRFLILAALVVSGFLSQARLHSAEPQPGSNARAKLLMADYRAQSSVTAKLKLLRDMEKVEGTAMDEFLLAEYAMLDGTRQPDAKLLGGILRVWATRRDRTLLPYLIYEGLFHDDADVVCACAAGLALLPEDTKAEMSTGTAARGKDPAEELAADLIQQMMEKAVAVAPIEKVLVLWTGKSRPGFKADADLKRKLDDKERAAVIAFWKGWYEGRFKQKLKPPESPAR